MKDLRRGAKFAPSSGRVLEAPMVRSSYVVAIGDDIVTHVNHPSLESALAHAAWLTGPFEVLELRNEIVVHKSAPAPGSDAVVGAGPVKGVAR